MRLRLLQHDISNVRCDFVSRDQPSMPYGSHWYARDNDLKRNATKAGIDKSNVKVSHTSNVTSLRQDTRNGTIIITEIRDNPFHLLFFLLLSLDFSLPDACHSHCLHFPLLAHPFICPLFRSQTYKFRGLFRRDKDDTSYMLPLSSERPPLVSCRGMAGRHQKTQSNRPSVR